MGGELGAGRFSPELVFPPSTEGRPLELAKAGWVLSPPPRCQPVDEILSGDSSSACLIVTGCPGSGGCPNPPPCHETLPAWHVQPQCTDLSVHPTPLPARHPAPGGEPLKDGLEPAAWTPASTARPRPLAAASRRAPAQVSGGEAAGPLCNSLLASPVSRGTSGDFREMSLGSAQAGHSIPASFLPRDEGVSPAGLCYRLSLYCREPPAHPARAGGLVWTQAGTTWSHDGPTPRQAPHCGESCCPPHPVWARGGVFTPLFIGSNLPQGLKVTAPCSAALLKRDHAEVVS